MDGRQLRDHDLGRRHLQGARLPPLLHEVCPSCCWTNTSAVFRDAHSAAPASGPLRVELSDTALETAPIFRFFLDAATTLQVRWGSALGRPSSQLLPLLLFLRKWDCAALLALALRDLERAVVAGKVRPLQAFNVGATLDAAEVCAAVLRRRWPRVWARADTWCLGRGRDYPFTPGMWSVRFWRENSIPPDYMFALVQAVTTTLGAGGESLAARFEAVLQEAREMNQGSSQPNLTS
jgi:hypothetical protein